MQRLYSWRKYLVCCPCVFSTSWSDSTARTTIQLSQDILKKNSVNYPFTLNHIHGNRMIALKRFISFSSRNTETLTSLFIGRNFSCLTVGKQNNSLKSVVDLLPSSTVCVVPFVQVPQQSRTYKHKDVLKLRCPGCYFVKKFGILHVECDLKPRHKQIAKMRGDQVYRDDYSKGKWQRGIHWGWKKRNAYYKLADPKYVKFNWLDGKLGKEI